MLVWLRLMMRMPQTPLGSVVAVDYEGADE
jgi:hypothetical protein